MERKGLDVDSLTMRDGSGLSRGDTLSTKLLTDVIMYMDNKKNLNLKNYFQ